MYERSYSTFYLHSKENPVLQEDRNVQCLAFLFYRDSLTFALLCGDSYYQATS